MTPQTTNGTAISYLDTDVVPIISSLAIAPLTPASTLGSDPNHPPLTIKLPGIKIINWNIAGIANKIEDPV